MSEIIFQNENFVVCDKDAEVLSVPAREKNDSRACLGLELQEGLGTQIFPVHRLDYDVSGLILYALHPKSHRQSQDWFLNKTIQKKYTALSSVQDFSHWPENVNTDRGVLSIEPQSSFIWKTQMQRGKKRTYESTRGEWAETKAVVERISDKEIEWTLLPVTGKPHQLRFELSRRGFPICGDQLYGSKVKWPRPGLALRAYELDLKNVKDRLGLPEKITIQKWDL